jgi:hypothetical protein
VYFLFCACADLGGQLCGNWAPSTHNSGSSIYGMFSFVLIIFVLLCTHYSHHYYYQYHCHQISNLISGLDFISNLPNLFRIKSFFVDIVVIRRICTLRCIFKSLSSTYQYIKFEDLTLISFLKKLFISIR